MLMLKIYGIVVGLLGILSCLAALDKPRYQTMAVGLLALSLVAMVAAAVLKRCGCSADRKLDVTKEI